MIEMIKLLRNNAKEEMFIIMIEFYSVFFFRYLATIVHNRALLHSSRGRGPTVRVIITIQQIENLLRNRLTINM